MRAYVGTLGGDIRSRQVAGRCVESGWRFGIDITQHPATHSASARGILKQERIKVAKWDESYSDQDAVLGNFCTQYSIWRRIEFSHTPAIVLEHDAVFVGPVPELKGDIVNLGKPSFGAFETKDEPGEYPFFSKPGYLGGAHGYYVTPEGAKRLIAMARKRGAGPCDLFLNTKNFPDMTEVWPWPIEAHDTFSTIQKRKGCLAKHNFGETYQHL